MPWKYVDVQIPAQTKKGLLILSTFWHPCILHLLHRISDGLSLKDQARAKPEPWKSSSSQAQAQALKKSSSPSLGGPLLFTSQKVKPELGSSLSPSQNFEPKPSLIKLFEKICQIHDNLVILMISNIHSRLDDVVWLFFFTVHLINEVSQSLLPTTKNVLIML